MLNTVARTLLPNSASISTRPVVSMMPSSAICWANCRNSWSASFGSSRLPAKPSRISAPKAMAVMRRE